MGQGSASCQPALVLNFPSMVWVLPLPASLDGSCERPAAELPSGSVPVERPDKAEHWFI